MNIKFSLPVASQLILFINYLKTQERYEEKQDFFYTPGKGNPHMLSLFQWSQGVFAIQDKI